jgi:tRNA wybutosine-synthesizing protein 1
MLTAEAKAELEHQQYRIIGSHSAVKPCGWTKTMIRCGEGCYKLKFYGIMSNQCLQMTTSISCANRCIFCWRRYKAPVAKEWSWHTDDAKFILNESIKAHHQLLVGFAGSDKKDTQIYQESKTVRHIALSLTGEPIIYPKINEFIELCNERGISTFLVTNGQFPEAIKNLEPVTQLYLSLDAPNAQLYKKIDVPLFADYWQRMLKSLNYLREKGRKLLREKGGKLSVKTSSRGSIRTCIRITLIKRLNDVLPTKYAELISLAKPHFVEVKSYMFVGPSRKRLKKENMPLHEDVIKFSRKLVSHLPDYEIVSEHIPSRVILLARKEFKRADGWYTWIDFTQWHKLINSGRNFSIADYSKKTPQVGLSGQGTIDRMPPCLREAFLKENPDF